MVMRVARRSACAAFAQFNRRVGVPGSFPPGLCRTRRAAHHPYGRWSQLCKIKEKTLERVRPWVEHGLRSTSEKYKKLVW
jgi:hypothetical protein